ncbi:MAG: transglutaminase-like domain-containing protein [Chloroflexota bacterium]
MKNNLTYFAQPGPMTDPGAYATLFDGLPADMGELCKIVQGTTVHIFWAERYGIKLTDERQSEVQLRTIQRRLARTLELDPRPLTDIRSLENKIVGNCRDFSVLLVSILRHQGVPARARCGFGSYFLPNHYEDHWVVEYWDAGQERWIFVDAQLDPFQCEALKVPFNPLDVPRDQFIVGGKAWQMCRTGLDDPDHFGIFDMHGLGFVRGDFIRDVASLNKVELLPWDCWGIIESIRLDDPDELALLDRLAELTSGDVPNLEAVRTLYETDPRLRMDGTIHSYLNTGMETIEVSLS